MYFFIESQIEMWWKSNKEWREITLKFGKMKVVEGNDMNIRKKKINEIKLKFEIS